MDRDRVRAWVQGYIDGWRNEDKSAVKRLFTEDVRYRTGPYEESLVGHPPLEEFWLDDAGRTFTAKPELVAVDGQRAVVFVEVAYGDPVEQEYRDLWLLRFADDGRVDDYEEWAYWPGKPYTAANG